MERVETVETVVSTWLPTAPSTVTELLEEEERLKLGGGEQGEQEQEIGEIGELGRRKDWGD